MVRLLAGRRYSDTSSGFRGFNQQVLAFFARNYPSEYMESVESLVLATLEGFDVVEVPVDMRQRAAGAPSSRRLRLVYHYMRLMLVLEPQPRPPPAEATRMPGSRSAVAYSDGGARRTSCLLSC